QGARPGVTFPLADALAWLLGARQLVLDVVGAGWDAVPFLEDLAHVQAARAAGEVGRVCAELVFGYNAHAVWDERSCAGCYTSDELDDLEGIIPGMASGARVSGDILEEG